MGGLSTVSLTKTLPVFRWDAFMRWELHGDLGRSKSLAGGGSWLMSHQQENDLFVFVGSAFFWLDMKRFKKKKTHALNATFFWPDFRRDPNLRVQSFRSFRQLKTPWLPWQTLFFFLRIRWALSESPLSRLDELLLMLEVEGKSPFLIEKSKLCSPFFWWRQ